MNRHDEAGEQVNQTRAGRTMAVGGMRRSVRSDVVAMAAALLGTAFTATRQEGKQESLDATLDEARRRHLTGEPQYNAEQRAAADAIRAEREKRRAENWAKRQPKGKA